MKANLFVIFDGELKNNDLCNMMQGSAPFVPKAVSGQPTLQIMMGLPRVQIGQIEDRISVYATNLVYDNNLTRGAIFVEFNDLMVEERLKELMEIARKANLNVLMQEFDLNAVARGSIKALNANFTLKTIPNPYQFAVWLSREVPRSGNIRTMPWREIQIMPNPTNASQIIINAVLRENMISDIIQPFLDDILTLYEEVIAESGKT